MCRFRDEAHVARGFQPRDAALKGPRYTRIGLALAVLTLSGCRQPSRASLDDDARRYVWLAVALGERDPDSLDFYAGPADAVADLRRDPPSLTAIKREAAALSARLSDPAYDASKDPAHDASAASDPSEAARAKALVADLGAIVARVNLLTGTRLPYDQESVAFFGVAPGPADDRRLGEIRSQIADAVGRGGRLTDRYAAFAARVTVPADRLTAVMEAALDECRRRTLAHVALPPGERVALEMVRDKPWSAFSRYLGDGHSVLQLNADFRFTVDQVLEVACHEAYPGHHTRNTLTAPRRGAADTRPERTVQLMFSPEALVSEASAMLAADVAFPPAERVRVERDRLFPLAGLDSGTADAHVAVERLVSGLQGVQAGLARRYLDGELEFARAVAALEDQALVLHAEALVKYINEYRSYVTTYTVGKDAFEARMAGCAGPDPSAADRWRCFLRESGAR